MTNDLRRLWQASGLRRCEPLGELWVNRLGKAYWQVREGQRRRHP